MGGKQRPHTHRTAASSSSSRRTGATTTTTTTFGFGGYSGSAEIASATTTTKASDRSSSKGFLEEQLSFGAGGDGDEERLMKAIALTAKPNAQSKKKGLEQVMELLEEKERNNNNNNNFGGGRDGTAANIQNEFESIASNAMPIWTRVHSKCLRNEKGSANTDETRLMSVKAHNLMCERSGKLLARCIGTTLAIPLILLARCDGDKNVAKEAESGFRRIFTTKERRAKALRFVAVDFFELVQESVQRAMTEFGGGNMKKSVQSSNNCKERDVIERDACASLRAMGQYVVDVFGFEEFREGEITLTTNEEKKTTTVMAALESALESLEHLRKLMMLESSTSLRGASLDCLRKLFMDRCETESEERDNDKNVVTFASFCDEHTAKRVLENIFNRIEREDDSFCIIRVWELVAGLSHAQWTVRKLSAWEVHPELSRTVIDGAIVRGMVNAFEGAAVGCAPCVLPLFASLALNSSTRISKGEEEECLRNTVNIVNAALEGAEDCEQFQSKNAEADAIAKASMECSLFALLRWLLTDEKKEALLKAVLVEKWVPRAIEARNSNSNSIDNITVRWVDVAAKTIASLASKPTAFPQRIVMSELENLGKFLVVSYDENPSRGAGICEVFKAINLELANKATLVPKEIHEKISEMKVSFANAIKAHEEECGGTDDIFLALAIETLSPDSFGGADEVARFIGRVTINRKEKHETAKKGGYTAVLDTTSIESLFAALKFASAETWSKHCEHILKTQMLQDALPHIVALLNRFVADNKQRDLKCTVIDDAFVRACENIVVESENGELTPTSQAFKAEIDFVKAFASNTTLIRTALNIEAYMKGLNTLSLAVEKTTTQGTPRNILCDFSWPPPPEVAKEETLLNFWAKKVVTVTFMNRCKDIIANNEDVFDNVEGVEEDGDVDDDDDEEDGIARDFARLCELSHGDSSWHAFLRSSYSDAMKANSNVESHTVLKNVLVKYIAEAIVRDHDVASLSVQTKFAHIILNRCFEVTNDVFANTFLELSDTISDSAEFAHAIASALGSWNLLVDAYVNKNADNSDGLVSGAHSIIATMSALAPKHGGLLSAVAKHEKLRDAVLDALVATQNDQLVWELASLPSTPSPADFILARKILISYGFIWENEEVACVYPQDDSILKTALSFDSCSKKTRILVHVVPKLLHKWEWMDAFLRCLVERIEIYYKDRSVNITSQPFFPALRLFGYFVSDHYTSNPLQKNIETIRMDIRKVKGTGGRVDEIGAFALTVWRAVETRSQSDKATAARLRALTGGSNEEDEFHDASTEDDIAIENEIDSARIHLAILSSAKTASEVDEKTWASVFESIVSWIDAFSRSSRLYLGQVSHVVVEEEIKLEVRNGLVVDRKFYLFELASSCLASIERFPIAVATPRIPEDEDVKEYSLYYNTDMDEMTSMEDICTDVDIDSLRNGGDVVAFASKSREIGQTLATSLARAKWPRVRRILLASALEPFINVGAALFEHIHSEESEDREGIIEPILREVSAAVASIFDNGAEDIFARSLCCSLAMRRFEYFAGTMLPESEVSSSSLNALFALLDDNIRFTPREAAYVAFTVLSSDDVVRAACFGIDCSYDDVNKIDAIVEKRYRDSKLQEAATSENDENDDYKMDLEEEETAGQELLAKYGLRENLIAMLKEERHATRVRDNDEDIKSSSDVKNADYAWSLVFRALSTSCVEVPRRAKLRLIQYIAKLNSKSSIISNAFSRILDSAPFYELASLLVEDENDYQEEKSSEVSITVCDYGNYADTVRAFAPVRSQYGLVSTENIPPRVFLALVGSFIEHFPSISRSAYRELDGKKAKKDFVNDLDFICENIFRKAFLDREIADIERFQNLRTSFASENVSNALSVRYSEKMSAIVARYDIDESFLEISIDIPETFPLKPAEPRESKRVGVSERRSRFWLLSLKTMLSSGSGLLNDAEEEDYETEDVSYTTTTSTTRGSILIAILKWSKFVDKFFEGAEPCPICYQVLAKSNGRKPEATCRQCSNSYHGDCLMKWFTTSSKSTCPMCQCSWGSTH